MRRLINGDLTQNHSLATETYKAGSTAVLTERKDRKDVTNTLWTGMVASQ